MRTRDFHYELPQDLIAQHPADLRSASRLLQVTRDTKQITHRFFTDLPSLLNKSDLLVFNNTRVIPARLFGTKATGGKVEILIERVIDDHSCLAHVKTSKTPKEGSLIRIGNFELKFEGREGDLFVLSHPGTKTITFIMEQLGHMPLPPYIARADEAIDFERYQTVYAKEPGAVAAPTAGLHFDEPLLDKIADTGVKFAYVTLHVGAGTFQPVRVENIADHRMHCETLEVDAATVELCQQTRANGGRIIAVGTTAVRALETAAASGTLQPYKGETDIFIYPGYTFKYIDALITNFHLPKSTLLMLVSAFAGRDLMMQAYEAAITQKYRFFSYGDAMLIE